MELRRGATIKKLRTERGITQEELANRMGVSFQAVSKWETNATTPDIAILPQLALFFGVSIDTLFSMNQDDYIERISKMIRDEYSIAPENFLWAERYTGTKTQTLLKTITICFKLRKIYSAIFRSTVSNASRSAYLSVITKDNRPHT